MSVRHGSFLCVNFRSRNSNKLFLVLERNWHLAQVNIARLKEPLDSELLSGFVSELDPVNSEADLAPGFVWRLKTEEGNATSLVAFDWDVSGSAGVLTNMSVWESFEALKDFVYSPRHLAVMKQRRQWFHQVAEATTALWWIEAGFTPSIQDAEKKIRILRERGPSQESFSLNKIFPPAAPII